MIWIRKNKEILLQILVFTAIGIAFHKTWMLYLVVVLLVILPFKNISSNYILWLNKIIHFIGFVIKTILFTTLFIFVIIPIAFILKLKPKDKNVGYISVSETMEKSSFLKMW